MNIYKLYFTSSLQICFKNSDQVFSTSQGTSSSDLESIYLGAVTRIYTSEEDVIFIVFVLRTYNLNYFNSMFSINIKQ